MNKPHSPIYTRRQFIMSISALSMAAMHVSFPSEKCNVPPGKMWEPIKATFGNLTLWGFATGSVKVKRSHYNPSLGIPQILVDYRWTEWLPIWTWVVMHPEGILVVDTGEVASIQHPGSLSDTGPEGWVSNRILKFHLNLGDELPAQMLAVGIHPDQVRWVVLTHLHLDHMDGITAFPNAEVLVSQTEWDNPFGAVMRRWPKNIKPHKIKFSNQVLPGFTSGYPLTTDCSISILPTPGHTYGHVSVLLQTNSAHVMLAGDVAFSQKQFLSGDVPGITADKKMLLETHRSIRKLASHQCLLFLPSHDPGNVARIHNSEWLL